MNLDRPAQLLELARSIADAIPVFNAVRGPGAGDYSTLAFMRSLRAQARNRFGIDFSERKVCGGTSFAVDFYFPDEATIVEVALSLPSPGSEFEKDVLKAIMAQDFGHNVKRLFFISRPGAAKKCGQPGRSAVMDWALNKHKLRIEIHELGGEPRRSRSAKKLLV